MAFPTYALWLPPINNINYYKTICSMDNNNSIEKRMEKKRLTRSADRVLGGVCGGIAEYFDCDPTLVRVGYLFLTFFTAFCGVIFYPILWLVIPEKG